MECNTPVSDGSGESGEVLGLVDGEVFVNVLPVEVPEFSLLFDGGIALSLLLGLGIGVSL